MLLDESILGFTGEYSFLSNFHPCNIVFEGKLYPTVEHAYQAAKTLDSTHREKIRLLRYPGLAKKEGRRVIIRDDWEQIKVDVMRRLLIQKFYSSSDLAKRLMDTGDMYIEETNTWGDKFWGVCDGQGKNVLGLLLMSIRTELQKIYDHRS